LSELVPKHDIVLVGQILVHLRDPLGALYQASLAANEYLVITEGSFESPTPSALFLGRDGNEMTWWHLSDTIYGQWLSLVGFDVVSTSKPDLSAMRQACRRKSSFGLSYRNEI
jgi:hypothetical protein